MVRRGRIDRRLLSDDQPSDALQHAFEHFVAPRSDSSDAYLGGFEEAAFNQERSQLDASGIQL